VSPSEGGVDRLVVARGAVAALLVGLPAALVNVLLADQDPKPKAALNLTLLVLLLAFFLGGLLSGWEARHDAARHGAVAGGLAFVPVQVVGVLGRLDRGDGVAPVQIVFIGALAVMAGTVGALAGARRRASRLPA
jgi:putative membrane protein (TIGR04086 family)